MQFNKTTTNHFFEKPITQTLLFGFIFISTAAVIIEFTYPYLFEQYSVIFHIIEYTCLTIFSLEYLLRLWASPKRLTFVARPYNIIDLVSIVPSYIELILAATPFASSLRIIRVVRLLRLSRLLRAFKLFRYKSFFHSIVRYEDTILQSITPVLVGFAALKGLVLLLEYQGWWFTNTNLSELFAIIGFALGIILSQKIGTTYNKFTQIEEVTVKIVGTLHTLSLLAPGPLYQTWAGIFIKTLITPSSSHRAELHQTNLALWQTIRTLEAQPSELTILYKDLLCDSQFCLSKAERLTPIAYDSLLHQATIVYLLLITAFVPGITGLVSIVIATYILYGMYRVTQDLDTIIGSDYKLINIDLTELRNVADNTL